MPDAKLATTEKKSSERKSHIGQPQSREQKPLCNSSWSFRWVFGWRRLGSRNVELMQEQPVHTSPWNFLIFNYIFCCFKIFLVHTLLDSPRLSSPCAYSRRNTPSSRSGQLHDHTPDSTPSYSDSLRCTRPEGYPRRA